MKKFFKIVCRLPLMILLICSFSYSKDPEDSSKKDIFRNIIHISSKVFEVTESSKELDKDFDVKLPARLSITIPDSGSKSTQIDVTIGISGAGMLQVFGFLSSTKHNINFLPFIEYHKNTLIAKKQDLFKSGAKLLVSVHKLFKPANLRLQLSSAANDSRDYVKEEWASQISSYLNFAFKSKPRTFAYYVLPQTYMIKIGDSDLRYNYYPTIGYEYSNLYRTSRTTKKGYIHTFYFGMGADLLIFDGFIQCNGEFQFRQYVKNTTAVTQKYFRLYKFGMNISLLKLGNFNNIEILFGYDYVKGENPWEGFEKQEYSQFSLKFKL